MLTCAALMLAVLAVGCGSARSKRVFTLTEVKTAFAAHGANFGVVPKGTATKQIFYQRETIIVYVLPRASDVRGFKVAISGAKREWRHDILNNLVVLLRNNRSNRELVAKALGDLRALPPQ